ncbi:PepSY domain-containing protein [uncultured Corynebacterium sp.]|uniref:PepSY-associated TM helix domain-containing protein n=1 Tax=uncultured Corynebacterium sp. TaxID=159447 RepID=UPI0025F7A294|nr:PepSY domain-containing protein [uncultured Corynebacterium sp.]
MTSTDTKNISTLPVHDSAHGNGNSGVRRLLLRLHFFAGIVCAPLILIAAVTGLAYAFSPTMENLVYRDALTATATGETRPVDEIVDVARQRHPDLRLAGVRLDEPGKTVRVLFDDPDLPDKNLRAVFVDPRSGEVTGDMAQYGSSNALPLRQWISQGHRTAWLGEPGRIYAELAASWLGVLAVGGVILWWRRNRARRTPGQTVAAMLRGTVRGSRGRARTLRLHGVTGTVIAAGMVFLTFTGLTWSLVAGENIGELRAALNWSTPKVSTDVGATGATGAAGAGSGAGGALPDPATQVNRVAATADRALQRPLTLTVPKEGGPAWTAAENRAPYRLENDAVAINGATGDVVDRLAFDDWPLAAKATAWLIQLHMGTLFGLPNQIVLGALAVAIIAMIVLGYRMWWRRRPMGESGPRLALAPARPRRVAMDRRLGVLVACLVAYALVAPLFGITCLAFVVGSVAWDRWGADQFGR